MLQRVYESCTLQREGSESKEENSGNIRSTPLLHIFVLIITIKIFPLLQKKKKNYVTAHYAQISILIKRTQRLICFNRIKLYPTI